jgi:hypothetical protein
MGIEREDMLHGLSGIRWQLVQRLILCIGRRRCEKGVEELDYFLLSQRREQLTTDVRRTGRVWPSSFSLVLSP